MVNKVENSAPTLEDKSKFVTVLAWIFIVITGFSTLVSILQNIMLSLMFPASKMEEVFESPEATEHIPAVARFMFSHFRLFFFGFFVVSAIILTSSIGLLRRKNWARILFIIIMGLGIIWNLGGIFLQGAMMPKIPQFSEVSEQPYIPNFQAMFTVMRIFTAIIAIGISILFAWVIKKLVSEKIRREFIRYSKTG